MANLKIALEIWLSKKILFRSVKTALVASGLFASESYQSDIASRLSSSR